MLPNEKDFVIGNYDNFIQSIEEQEESNNAKTPVICRCPCCKSEKTVDISTYANNGVFGPGFASWKTFDVRSCTECGVMFKPVQGNGI